MYTLFEDFLEVSSMYTGENSLIHKMLYTMLINKKEQLYETLSQPWNAELPADFPNVNSPSEDDHDQKPDSKLFFHKFAPLNDTIEMPCSSCDRILPSIRAYNVHMKRCHPDVKDTKEEPRGTCRLRKTGGEMCNLKFTTHQIGRHLKVSFFKYHFILLL